MFRRLVCAPTLTVWLLGLASTVAVAGREEAPIERVDVLKGVSVPVSDPPLIATDSLAEDALSGHARELRTTVQGGVDNSSGPLFPLFYDDFPGNDDVVFFKPETKIFRDIIADASPTPIPGCQYGSVGGCATNMTSCLLVNPVDHDTVCGCMYGRSKCLRDIGCYDTILRVEIDYCFVELHCSMWDCEGQEAGASHASAAAAALVLAAISVIATARVSP